MISKAEKRFVRSWQEQREGGKWPYYFQYTIAGALIVALVTYILLLWIFQVRVPRPLWAVPVVSVFAGVVISVVVWSVNEKKFKRIIRREVKSGGG